MYGIDPWHEAIERARHKCDYYGISNVRIIEGVAESIPLEDRSIDLIVSNNGINNVKDLDQVFSECARIARPDAQCVLTMNLDKSLIEFYTQMQSVLSDLGLFHEIDLMHAHIYQKRRPLEEMLERLERYGFEIRKSEHDQFTYRFTDGTAMLNHGFVRLAFLLAWKSILPIERVEEIFHIIESRLNILARGAGGMQLSVPFVVINANKRQDMP